MDGRRMCQINLISLINLAKRLIPTFLHQTMVTTAPASALCEHCTQFAVSLCLYCTLCIYRPTGYQTLKIAGFLKRQIQIIAKNKSGWQTEALNIA